MSLSRHVLTKLSQTTSVCDLSWNVCVACSNQKKLRYYYEKIILHQTTNSCHSYIHQTSTLLDPDASARRSVGRSSVSTENSSTVKFAATVCSTAMMIDNRRQWLTTFMQQEWLITNIDHWHCNIQFTESITDMQHSGHDSSIQMTSINSNFSESGGRQRGEKIVPTLPWWHCHLLSRNTMQHNAKSFWRSIISAEWNTGTELKHKQTTQS